MSQSLALLFTGTFAAAGVPVPLTKEISRRMNCVMNPRLLKYARTAIKADDTQNHLTKPSVTTELTRHLCCGKILFV
jgi:hypothetical protein